MDVSTLLTQIGALTGFAAFVMKCWEFVQDRRPRLSVAFAGVGRDGDVVLVFNSSKIPTTIHRYSVDALPSTWLNRQWPRFDETETLVVRAREPIDVEVPAHGQVRLTLGDDPEASMRRYNTAPNDLYLRLWTTARKKPFTFSLLTKRSTA
jgi:hypothetical protein